MRFGVLFRAALICFGLLGSASAAQAANCTSCVWTGGAATANWSAGGNWSGGNPPSSPLTSLGFPSLGSCSGSTCYSSNNDLGALATTTFSIDDGSPYTITGNGIVIGSGGLQGSTSSLTPLPPTISTPVSLSAGQTWSIDGGSTGTAGLTLTQSVSDAAPMALALNLTNHGILALQGGADVGSLAVSGSGGPVLRLGTGASLNGASGSSVTFGAGTSLIAAGGGSVGPLTLASASLQVGAPSSAAILSDFSGGSNSFDAGSTLTLSIPQAGISSGSSYSQFRAAGPIAVGGTLQLTGPSPCPTLHVGDQLPIVSTTATLSGTFSNAANGSTMQLTCSGGTPATFQINYTSSAVLATVISGTSTTLSVTPSSAVTDQPVTLTANVSPAYGSAAPAGTVEFDNGGTAIPGCGAQVVDGTGKASCQTQFTATSSPESLTARFTPNAGSGFSGSSSASATSLSVGKVSTSTSLSASTSAPSAGDAVTYTAVITPTFSGPTLMTGDVQFFDNGVAITDCTDATQSTTSASTTATCTTSYSAAGSHTITAGYSGDSNFSASSSAGKIVTVTGGSGGGGGGGGGGNGSSAGKGRLVLVGTTLKVRGGVVSLALKCSSRKACSGGFVMTGLHKGKRTMKVVCAAGSYRIAAGKTKQVSAKVSATCLSGLRHARSHRIQLRFSSKPKSGQAGVSTPVELVR